ncbi:phytanoyl-CoA dioxygenase family protein [Hoeflea sp. AS60]|uniref:phytanoyl-CoA dioxygenase family protein n=1 Tax=Hoeflea sp. AS60 TaxID=3135780 RepID=UPI00316CF905
MQDQINSFSAQLSLIYPVPVPIREDQLRDFQNNGFVTVKGLFSKEEVSSISEASERVVSEGWAPTEHYGRTFRSWRAITTQSEELAGVACDPRMVTVAMQCLGARIKLVGSQLIHRLTLDGTETSRTPNAPGWHRDVFGMDRDLGGESPLCAVKATVWLSSATKVENGATLFVAGSQKDRKLPEIPSGKADPKTFSRTQPDIGDVTFFENRVAHAGGYNVSPQTLKFALFQYGYRWLQPVAGQYHSAGLLDLCSDFCRELLQPIELDENNCYRPENRLPSLENWFESSRIVK